ncbi:ap2 domain transcription factor ap2iii-4 [Cystoisospora suis]|uniref:Ap2 domain transcription factor ap2iii-4 n=1 Tax=Cystoisospora suis TaxID=483139 RepID=A0A2C6KY17_9APIC|nr:ap2 domain transcription factor ap2iii-4 [Cystoisospora suis]
MTSGSAVIGSGPTPGCLPAVDLQQQQELLNQASAWAAASHSLLSERLDKDSLQQFLPFDLGHALGHHRASPHAGLVGMGFNSARDGAALGTFPQTAESLLSHAPESFSPIDEPCNSAQRQLLVMRPPQARSTKIDPSTTNHCLDSSSSQPQALPASSMPSSSVTPTTGTPSGTATTSSSRFGRQRKRKDPPSDHTTLQLSRHAVSENALHVQDRGFHDGDDCDGVWRNTGAPLEEARVSQDGSVYTSSTSSDNQSQSRRNHRNGQTEASVIQQQEGNDPEGGRVYSREGGRTTVDSGTTPSVGEEEGDASKAKKKDERTTDEEAKRRRLAGNSDSNQENDCKSWGTVPRTPPSHSGGSTATSCGHGEGQEAERLLTGNSLSGQAKEVKEEDGCDRRSSGSSRGAGGQTPHSSKGSGSTETTVSGRRRCTGGETHQLADGTEKSGSRTANSSEDCYQSYTGPAAGRPADDPERSDRDGDSALLLRGSSGDGERTDCGRDPFTSGSQTPLPVERLSASENLTPSPRHASESFLFPCYKRRSILSASSFASSLLIPSNFSLAAFALAAGPESSASPKALQDQRGAGSVLPPLCPSVRTCRNSPDSPLSCPVPVSVSSCPGRTSSCCCGFRPLYQSSGLGVNCCGRRWPRSCCGDRCQIIPHHPPAFACSHHLKEAGRYSGSPCTRVRGKGNNLLQASSRQRKEEGWDSLTPLASSSSSPAFSYSSSCCRNSCGPALQSCGTGTEECKFDTAVLEGKAEVDCAHSPSTSERNKSAGPILILHLTKELLLLLLQSVQDAVSMLTAENPSAAQTPRVQDSSDGSAGDGEQVAGRHGQSGGSSGVGTCCESNSKTEERPDEGSGTANEKRGTIDCGVSPREAMVCVAVLERHKQTVRSASNVDDLARYTKVFRACIKTKQVPTQLPQTTLLQLLRQLLTMSPRQSEEDSGTAACRRTERTEQMRACLTGNPDTSLADRERFINTGCGAHCRQGGDSPGPLEEKASTDSETGQSKGGRSSRVTTAGSDEAGGINDEDSDSGEGGQTDLSREAADARELRGSHDHGYLVNTGTQGMHQGGRQNNCRREDQGMKERIEEKAFHHAQSQHHSHRHNTRSRSNGHKGHGAGNLSNTRTSAQTGLGADVSDDPVCLGSLSRSATRSQAGRRSLYKTRQQSLEAEHSENRSSGCADDKNNGQGKEGQCVLRPGEARDSALGVAGGVQLVSSDTRGRSHRQQAVVLQKESSVTSTQVSPSLSPNLSRTASIDKSLVNAESTEGDGTLHAAPPTGAEETDNGLITGPSSDYESADGSAMREGEAAVQDSLVQLLL